MSFRRLASLLVAAAIPACSLLTSLDDSEYTSGTRGAPPEADAGDAARQETSSDASKPPTDASRDAPDANLTDLMPEGTFEPPSSDCQNVWARAEITATRVAGGHDSGFACQLCATSTAIWAFDHFAPVGPPVVPGDRHQSRVWVRSLAGTKQVESRIRLFSDSAYLEASSSNLVLVGTTWQELVVTHVATVAASRLNPVVFGEQFQVGDCVLVDDVRVYKLP
jgi:hypothetical protein